MADLLFSPIWKQKLLLVSRPWADRVILQAGTPSPSLSRLGEAGVGAGCGAGRGWAGAPSAPCVEEWLLSLVGIGYCSGLEGLSLSLLGARWQEAGPAPWPSVPSASGTVLGGELGVPGWRPGCSVAPTPSMTSQSQPPPGLHPSSFKGVAGSPVLREEVETGWRVAAVGTL